MYYWFQGEARKMGPSPVHFWDWNRPALPRLPGPVSKLAAGRVTRLTPGGLMFLWVVPMEILSRGLWVCSANKQRLGWETSDGRQWPPGKHALWHVLNYSLFGKCCLSVCLSVHPPSRASLGIRPWESVQPTLPCIRIITEGPWLPFTSMNPAITLLISLQVPKPGFRIKNSDPFFVRSQKSQTTGKRLCVNYFLITSIRCLAEAP